MIPVIRQLSQQMSSFQEKALGDPNIATAAVVKQVKRLLMVAQHLCS